MSTHRGRFSMLQHPQHLQHIFCEIFVILPGMLIVLTAGAFGISSTGMLQMKQLALGAQKQVVSNVLKWRETAEFMVENLRNFQLPRPLYLGLTQPKQKWRCSHQGTPNRTRLQANSTQPPWPRWLGKSHVHGGVVGLVSGPSLMWTHHDFEEATSHLG